MKLEKDPAITGEIYSLLYDLGVKADTVSFFHTAYAIRLAAEQPEKLLLITKWLYPEVARHYHSNWMAVERNIRRTVHTVWEKHPNQLMRLAGHKIPSKPTPAQFLAILCLCLRRTTVA